MSVRQERISQFSESRRRIVISKLECALRKLSPAPGGRIVYGPDLEDAKGFIEQAIEEVKEF